MLYKVLHELMGALHVHSSGDVVPATVLLLLHMSDAVKHLIPAMRSRQRVPTI